MAPIGVLLLAVLLAGGGGALLHSGGLEGLLPTRIVFAPTSTPLPTYTPYPTATVTLAPTATPVPPTATPVPPTPTATPIPAGNGLTGSYYQGVEPTGTVDHQRVDADINFSDWATSPPYPDLPNNFSVRWTGRIRAPQAGTYTISTLSDDGVRVVINNEVVIDNWTYHAQVWNSGQITFNAGQFYSITVSYFQGGGLAVMELYWQSPGGQQVIIPQSALYAS